MTTIFTARQSIAAIPDELLADLCASFQASVVDVLVR